jgi:hypothetical protein
MRYARNRVIKSKQDAKSRQNGSKKKENPFHVVLSPLLG